MEFVSSFNMVRKKSSITFNKIQTERLSLMINRIGLADVVR
jgi:hypothetical protein